jgi:hypothetical protein
VKEGGFFTIFIINVIPIFMLAKEVSIVIQGLGSSDIVFYVFVGIPFFIMLCASSLLMQWTRSICSRHRSGLQKVCRYPKMDEEHPGIMHTYCVSGLCTHEFS